MRQPPLHLRGVLVPDDGAGEQDLWIHDGRITFDPVPRAETITEGTCWLMPGLVDLHSHIGLAASGAVPDEVTEEQALTERDAGVLLVRDAGSAADTRWVDDREDLPRIVRAGRHIARTKRYIRNYAHEVEPELLVACVQREARRGDGWVKIVGDWIDRSEGDLAPCWPDWALQAAIDRAHELGARVTAHVFGETALPALVDAGIDCIEHATGLSTLDDGRLRDRMAASGVAIVPTLLNIDNFPRYADAGQERFPTYARHMRALHATSRSNVLEAFESGVPVYAGTDAGGTIAHGLVAQEVLELCQAGIPAADAVAAASWRARAFLLGGNGVLQEGEPADLLVLDADPTHEPRTLLTPRRILLRGRVVNGAGPRSAG